MSTLQVFLYSHQVRVLRVVSIPWRLAEVKPSKVDPHSQRINEIVVADCPVSSSSCCERVTDLNAGWTMGLEQSHDRYRPHHDELQRVPNADKSNGVEPAGRSPVDQRRTSTRGEEIRDGKEHRGHAPLEPAAGANRVEQDVGRHEPAHEVAEVNADNPDDSKHDNGPLMVRQR